MPLEREWRGFAMTYHTRPSAEVVGYYDAAVGRKCYYSCTQYDFRLFIVLLFFARDSQSFQHVTAQF